MFSKLTVQKIKQIRKEKAYFVMAEQLNNFQSHSSLFVLTCFDNYLETCLK